MTDVRPDDPERFPMRVAAHMAGITPERIRAWETRYGAVEPERSQGGSRRYSIEDVNRLRLLREVVEAGHRIGDVATLALEDLSACLPDPQGTDFGPDHAGLQAVDQLEAARFKRWLSTQLEALGPVAFARDVVLPLSVEIGDRWERSALSIAAEHMATSVMRSMLCELLIEDVDRMGEGAGFRILFATSSGEYHDMGVLVAAIAARHAGATPIFLGADVPEDEILAGASTSKADVVVIGFTMSSDEDVQGTTRRVREALPPRTELWVGGAASARLSPLRGVDRIGSIRQLEAFVIEATGGLNSDSTAEREAKRLGRGNL